MVTTKLAGSTESHAAPKGQASSTWYYSEQKKRKFEHLTSRDAESILWTEGAVALTQHLAASASSIKDKKHGRDLDLSYVDKGPSKKMKIDGYSIIGSSPVEPVLELNHSPKAPLTLLSDGPSSTEVDETPDSLRQQALRKKRPKETMSIVDRKCFLIYTPTKLIRRSMRAYISEVYALCNNDNISTCWLHPSPPSPNRFNGRSPNVIKCHFSWKAVNNVYHSIGVNFGIIALIVEQGLMNIQKRGFIYDSWHLSHLCMNWTCCNWKHFTVEPGPDNVSRNACLLSNGLPTRKSDGKCKHRPQCMRGRKIKNLMEASYCNGPLRQL